GEEEGKCFGADWGLLTGKRNVEVMFVIIKKGKIVVLIVLMMEKLVKGFDPSLWSLAMDQ
ncbi:hypothetical protein HAX54_016215, partial [Datura stramonium]|nr:hypothetical protein [Datura stramonium]